MNNEERTDYVKYSSRKGLEEYMLDSLNNDFRVVKGYIPEKYRKQPWFQDEAVQITEDMFFVPKFRVVPRKMTLKVETKKELKEKKRIALIKPEFHAKIIQDKESWCELF